jgi:hypothetical protein
LSGLGIGFARAAVLTTKNVKPSEPFFDQNYAEDPTAHVEYYGSIKEEADWTIGEGKFNGGIRAQVTLQNAVGYKRTTWRQQVLQVRRVRMPGKIRIRLRKGWGSIDPGVCYIIYRETKFKAIYSKEELVVPESYRIELDRKETPDIVIKEPGTGLYGENPL